MSKLDTTTAPPRPAGPRAPAEKPDAGRPGDGRNADGRPGANLRVVGTSLPKVDAVAKVTGRTRFADDLFLPRMLHCRMLRAT
ncbi:MAG: hypothetical protein ACRDSE_21585, partial [Pseudonocardiaceae bacterium]